MIKENEIRIGNWVIDNTREKSRYIKLDSNEVYELIGTGNWDYIEPIPITPSILEKAGFELELKFESGDYWFHEKMRTFAASRMYIYLPYSLFDSMAPCKYVHQLQNLYWVLVGEELEISL
jgi:hypothetical protein